MTPASLSDAVLGAARSVFAGRGLDLGALPERASVERTRNREHGDYASTLALQLGERVGVAPRELAAAIAEELGRQPGIKSVEVAGPGFLNIRLDVAALGALACDIVLAAGEYGHTGQPINVGLGWADPTLTLEDLIDALGVDAARYAFARYSSDSLVNIDIDLWTRATPDNPVYYVQYIAARTASVACNAAEVGLTRGAPEDFRPELLAHETENELLKVLGQYPAMVASAAELREPHRVARYLEELAGTYHRFYDQCRVLPVGDEPITDLRRARLWLNDATRTVIANGLGLLGVSAPERM